MANKIKKLKAKAKPKIKAKSKLKKPKKFYKASARQRMLEEAMKY